MPIELLVHLSSGDRGQPLYYSFLTDLTERKQAEQALRESEAQFRTLANAIPQLCWMANADGWIFWYNQRWYEYTGTTPEQMEGWGWQSVHDPEALPRVLERWQASIATGQPFDMVFPLRGADGVFRPFLTRVTPVFGSDRKVDRWFGTNTDISEQRQSQEALRRQSEWLRVTLGSIGDAVLATGADGSIAFLNPVAAALTGWTEAQALGRPARDVFRTINEETREKAEDIVARVLREARPVTLANHTALVTRDGREIPIEDSAAPILDAAGQGIGAVLVFHEVTEKRRAQEALRESERRYRQLFETMSEGFALCEIVCDDAGKPRDYRHLAVNPAFERQTGIQAAYILTHTSRETLPHAEPIWLERYGKVALTGEPAHFEAWFGPLERWLEVSAFQTEPGRFGVVFSDVTARRRAEEALRESEAVLRSFFDSGGVLRGIVDIVDGVITHVACNAAAAEMYGIDRDSITGKTAQQAGASDEVARQWAALYEKSRITGQPVSMEYSRRDAAGRDLWMLATANYLGTASSGHPRFAYTALDFTARKRAEDALRESEERLRLAQISGGVGVWEWNPRTDTLYLTPEFEQLYGLPPGTLKTHPDWRRMVHPDDLAEVAAKRDAAIASHKPFEMEFRILHASGEIRWLSGTGGAVYDDAGEAARIFGVNIDITVRKLAEERLRQSELQLRTLGDNLPQGAIYQYRVDAGGKHHIDFISAGIERLTGVPASEFLEDVEAVFRHIVPEDRATLQAAIALSHEGLTHFEMEVRHIHRQTGELRWSLLRSTPSRLPDGSTVWDGIELDITERKRAEESLRESEEQLQRRVEEVETVMEVAPVAIWVSQDPRCNAIVGNRTANSFYEADQKENVSANVSAARRFFHGGRELSPRAAHAGGSGEEHRDPECRAGGTAPKREMDVYAGLGNAAARCTGTGARVRRRIYGHHRAQTGRGVLARKRGALPHHGGRLPDHDLGDRRRG